MFEEVLVARERCMATLCSNLACPLLAPHDALCGVNALHAFGHA